MFANVKGRGSATSASGTLIVRCVGAQGIVQPGKSSPPQSAVVTVEVDGRDVATSNGAAANAPSPVWGQDLKIELEKADTVVLQVCDAKMVGEDNICGAHELDLKVLRNDNHPRRHKVDLKPTGILHIELRWDCKGKWDTLSTGFDCSHALHHGSVLVKYPRGSFGTPHERFFWVAEDGISLFWLSNKGKMQRKSIPISQIREIRKGQKTDRFKKFSKIYGSRNKTSFSIIYGSEYASLDVIAGDDDEVRVWCVGLQHLIDKNAGKAAASGGESSGGAAASSLSGLELRERRLRKVWDQGDKNGDGQLTLVEVEKLLPVLNCPMNKKKVRQLFDAANTSGTTLDFGEFVTFYTALTEREEVTALMNRYSGGKDTLTVDQLRKFLTETQREVGRNIDSLLTSYEPSDEARAAKMMTRDGFTALLFGPECSVFQEAHGRVYQDMDHPLTDYYMASSHNTYLLEDQLKGPSSVEAYIRALRDGCRCVELDCWDGPDDEPIVYHGLTLTSKILFKDIVAAIKEHAFASSPYPVVLSLENHCSVPQQAIMAQHLTSILGSMLAQGDPDETREKMPSPEELKGKVLCKAKRPKVDDDGAAAAAKAAEEAAAAAADDSDDSDSDDDDDNEEVPKISEEEKAQLALKKKKVKVAPELARLILYCQAVHFHSFEDSAKRGKYYQMSSFGEAKTRKLSAKNSNAFMLYNQKQFSRVYPAGSRVDSSNYDPTFAWNAGCQIVALNYQTPGRSMQLNRGRFRQNGACGYVLKPAVMRDPNSAYDVNAKKPAKGVLRKTITVRVISGQNLPKPGEKSKGEVIDPYVVVELVGVPADAAQHTTKTVDDNGFNPMWDETFVFNTIMPDVALLRFKVMDKDLDADDFIGQFCCPVDSLAQGFRTVHLERADGLRLEQGWLFVEIKIDVEVPKI